MMPVGSTWDLIDLEALRHVTQGHTPPFMTIKDTVHLACGK